MSVLRRAIIQSLQTSEEDMNIIEIGTGTLLSTDPDFGTEKTIALAQTVDLTKAAVFITGSKWDETPASQDFMTLIIASFADADNVFFKRNGTGTEDVSFNYLVVEFPSAISVSYYSGTVGGGDTIEDVTISAVNLSNRLLTFDSFRAGGVERTVRSEVTTATNLRVERGGTTGSTNFGTFVIELPA